MNYIRSLGFLFLICILTSLISCKSESDEISEEVLPDSRGVLIQNTKIESYTAEEIQQEIAKFLPPVVSSLIVPRFGVDVHKITHSSVDLEGDITKVSGAIFVPQGVSEDLPWISYQHGTVTNKAGVPSRGLQNSFEVLIGLMLAGDGTVVSMSDYLGLGDNSGFHPFLHAESEAWASLDMMKATKEFCQELGIPLNRELFLTGYSQGGHSTMALQREIENGNAPEFNLTASSPMAGPFSLNDVMLDIIAKDDTFANMAAIPYLFLSYDEIYDWYDDPADVFRGEYASLVFNLFNGNFSIDQINDRLPERPDLLLQADLIEGILNDPLHPFRLALDDNDLLNWTPFVPTRLYHCNGDEIVDYENSLAALDYFKEQGAPSVELVTPDNLPGFELDHITCAFLSIILVREWFKEFWE